MVSSYLIAAAALSLSGVVLMVLGRRRGQLWTGLAGIVLLVLPCVIFKAWLLGVLAGLTVAGLLAARRGNAGLGAGKV